MNRQRIMIAGGCGFIGINLIEKILNETNHEIVVLDNLYSGNEQDLIKISLNFNNRLSFIKGDITNKLDIDRAIQGCNAVVNLAAQVGVIDSIKDPVFDAKINIFGTINLLNSCVSNGVKHFIAASSAAPLGKQVPPVNEKSLPLPLSPYGSSKLASEAYCSSFSECYKIDTTVLRFSNVFGPFSLGKSSVLSVFLKKIIKEERVIIYGDGSQTRDFIYVDDICQSICLSLKKKLNQSYAVYQIGTGIETSLNSFFSSTKDIMELNGFSVLKPAYLDWREGEVKRSFTDIKFATNNLNYKPRFSLIEGLKITIPWFIKNYKESL